MFTCFKFKEKVKTGTTNSISIPFDYSLLDDTTNPGHIYMIQEREFIKTNENIYKIGKSKNIVNRMPAYPKHSKIFLIFYIPYNVNKLEKYIIENCDKIFICRSDIGREYYECSSNSMIQLLETIMKTYIYT